MRVFLQALGCRLNEAELEDWSRDCRERGYQLADDAGDADLVIVNTCAVTGESVRKSRQLIRRIHRGNPTAKLVVSGCHASLSPGETAAEHGVDLVVANSDKSSLLDIAVRALDLPVMPQAATEPGAHSLLSRGRHRAFVKVQDGCRYRCAFCIVTKARGEERSRPLDQIVDEISAVAATGVKEVVLAGVHLGGYGSDTAGSLHELVQAVLETTTIPRVRLGSLEPWELSAEFWSLFDDPRLMPHLHLPMQSGADSVLRRMSRRCRSDEFRELAARARTSAPGFNITTDIIAGFPGETDDEWQQTLDFVDRLGFGHVHIFAYSPRAGTKAADMPGQLPHQVKRARSRQLHALAKRSRHAVMESHIGRSFEVLVERQDGGRWSGYTPNYLRVGIDGETDAALENRIVRVRTTGISDDGELLLAELSDV